MNTNELTLNSPKPYVTAFQQLSIVHHGKAMREPVAGGYAYAYIARN